MIQGVWGNLSVERPRTETTVGWVWSPQAALHEKPSCHHDQYNHMDSGGAWKTIFTQHSPGCIQKYNLKLHYTRKKPYIKYVQKHGPVLWTPAHLRWTKKRVDTCSVVRGVHVSAAFGKNWRLLLQRWERASRSVIRERFKASVCDGMGVHQCPWHGFLHMCKGTTDAEVDVRVAMLYATIKVTSFPGRSVVISAGRCQISFYTTSNSVASYTQSVCAWLACLQSTSVSYWKCMEHHEEENQTTITTDCWEADVLDSARMDTDSSEKLQQSVSSVPKPLKHVIKRKLREHNGKHDSGTAFTECVDASVSTFGSVFSTQWSEDNENQFSILVC